ncbi:MAG: hypothetical protein MK161_07965 [Pirellulales bacterium]|jgi:hypothetical protein|nr:hypothetical protein [Pirellulales bacterium]
MAVAETVAISDQSSLWGRMPARIKVLYITTLHRTGGWLMEAFAADCATDILLDEAVGVTSGLSRLRDEVFDAVLVSHEPGVLDAVELVEGLRVGGHDEPMIVLGMQPSTAMDANCHEVGADAYCCVEQTTTRSLLWCFARAIERSQLIRENRRLVQADRQRLAHEQTEAKRLLDEQRAVIADLELLHKKKSELHEPSKRLPPQDPIRCQLPEPLVKHYSEMLRAYVIMGAGNLTDEMTTLANLLAESGISAQQTMQLHVHVLEKLIQDLAGRSARHVMTRADLLVVEVMAHLADGYCSRYPHRKSSSPACTTRI